MRLAQLEDTRPELTQLSSVSRGSPILQIYMFDLSTRVARNPHFVDCVGLHMVAKHPQEVLKLRIYDRLVELIADDRDWARARW